MPTVILIAQLFLASGEIARFERAYDTIESCYQAAQDLAKSDVAAANAVAIAVGCYVAPQGQPS